MKTVELLLGFGRVVFFTIIYPCSLLFTYVVITNTKAILSKGPGDKFLRNRKILTVILVSIAISTTILIAPTVYKELTKFDSGSGSSDDYYEQDCDPLYRYGC